MAQQVLRSERISQNTLVRDLMVVAGFAAILVADGYVSSLARSITRTTDVFFLIATLFTLAALITRRTGMPTLLGVIAGLIFLGAPGSPFPPHITVSLVANGLAFDLALMMVFRRSGEFAGPTRNQLLVAGSLGNMAMAIIALVVLETTVGVNIPIQIWPAIIFGDGFVGTIGAWFGFVVGRRLHLTRLQPLRY